MKLEGKTIEEASKAIEFLRRFAPFRFGGTWFIAQLGDEFEAYRTKAAAFKNAAGNHVYKVN